MGRGCRVGDRVLVDRIEVEARKTRLRQAADKDGD